MAQKPSKQALKLVPFGISDFFFACALTGDGMKKTSFIHTQLTTKEVDELEARYRANDVRTVRSLDFDLIHWTLTAYLPEANRAPRQDKTFQQKLWREA
ncbi:hypothetical protein AAHB66_09000 [Leclercia sp. S52]|uniref:hypothetical protein n=2 Tax=Enterobacterales TaxID=91347 RepID=UPI00321AD8BC